MTLASDDLQWVLASSDTHGEDVMLAPAEGTTLGGTRDLVVRGSSFDSAEAALTNAKGRLKTIPAKIPANQLDPNAQRAILRTRRRSLQMVLRLLAFNAEQWLADRLNTYLADNDEYRATLRHLLHLGGHITYTTKTITVALDPPPTPKITRALRLLLAELNTTPPRIPGDHRPITYAIKTA